MLDYISRHTLILKNPKNQMVSELDVMWDHILLMEEMFTIIQIHNIIIAHYSIIFVWDLT